MLTVPAVILGHLVVETAPSAAVRVPKQLLISEVESRVNKKGGHIVSPFFHVKELNFRPIRSVIILGCEF
jgi:hypothetical protein